MRSATAAAHDGRVDPLVTGDSIDMGALHVIGVVVLAIVVGVIGVACRRVLMAAALELVELWREHVTPAIDRRVRRRRSLPATPWFCARCSSRNGVAASVCYSCGATREEAEAPVPDAEAPAGASAGRTQRNRRAP